jgi:uncharacterized NAD-dependent epimerase/dehydratase family protein
MDNLLDGNALIYCEGAFGTPNGKTAHGLVRRTYRYRVLGVVDSVHAGKDAGTILDGHFRGIPVYASIRESMESLGNEKKHVTHMVIGLAPDGGRLGPGDRNAILEALGSGLHVDSGLHDFLSDDKEISGLAAELGKRIRDIRKPPHIRDLHFFSGKIEEVSSLKIAVLGTDSAVGKRTTAWILLDAFQSSGYSAELIGTGQTAWMQGVRYGVILDSLINDFVSGEIEHAVWKAWKEERPQVIIIEGQGSLMNPAYPGGFEILAAGRPEAVIVQHAPARKDYDGFPGYPIHPLEDQIRAIELISGKPVVAVTLNHELLKKEEVPGICADITRKTGLPACDVLLEGAGVVVDALENRINK